MRAVDKWVTVTAVVRIIQFAQAVVTGKQVCGQVNVCLGVSQAGNDDEFIAADMVGVADRLQYRSG